MRSMKTKRQSKSKTQTSKGIDGKALRSTAAVLDWLAGNAKALGLRTDNYETQANVLACAERAMEVGDKPGGLFVALVRNRDWSFLTDHQWERAKGRLRSWQITERRLPDEVQHVLNRIGVNHHVEA